MNTDKVAKELSKPYFKRTYKGKPTKRYLKVLKWQAQFYDKYSMEDVKRIIDDFH